MLCVLWLAVLSTAASEVGELGEFESVLFKPGGVLVTFKDHGSRFNYRIGSDERKISVYSESVLVTSGKTAEFVAKELKIQFLSQSGGDSIIVVKTTDLRSFGGNLVTQRFAISDLQGKTTFGEVIQTSEPP